MVEGDTLMYIGSRDLLSELVGVENLGWERGKTQWWRETL